jgi:hypothetical protein
VVAALVDAFVEDANYTGMVDLSGQPGLAMEPLDEFLDAVEVGMEKLKRHRNPNRDRLFSASTVARKTLPIPPGRINSVRW